MHVAPSGRKITDNDGRDGLVQRDDGRDGLVQIDAAGHHVAGGGVADEDAKAMT